jgi:hypothetical protein
MDNLSSIEATNLTFLDSEAPEQLIPRYNSDGGEN